MHYQLVPNNTVFSFLSMLFVFLHPILCTWRRARATFFWPTTAKPWRSRHVVLRLWMQVGSTGFYRFTPTSLYFFHFYFFSTFLFFWNMKASIFTCVFLFCVDGLFLWTRNWQRLDEKERKDGGVGALEHTTSRQRQQGIEDWCRRQQKPPDVITKQALEHLSVPGSGMSGSNRDAKSDEKK